MIDPPRPWQLQIPFAEIVRSIIGPVVSPFGFTSQELQPNLVRYTNGRVTLDVSHEPHDGEVAINFGRTGTNEHYSLQLYVRSRWPDDEGARQDGVSWTGEEVHRTLIFFARALKTYGTPVLEGDPKTFEAMRSVRWWNVPGGPG